MYLIGSRAFFLFKKKSLNPYSNGTMYLMTVTDLCSATCAES